ncbi:transposase [Saccharothrix sp. 6-C]|nr:transposase [Saccharothrix sp. 6-C]
MIHRESTGTYGVPRTTAELHDTGHHVNHKRAPGAGLLRERAGLAPVGVRDQGEAVRRPQVVAFVEQQFAVAQEQPDDLEVAVQHRVRANPGEQAQCEPHDAVLLTGDVARLVQPERHAHGRRDAKDLQHRVPRAWVFGHDPHPRAVGRGGVVPERLRRGVEQARGGADLAQRVGHLLRGQGRGERETVRNGH